MNNPALFAVEAYKLLENGELQEALSISQEGVNKYVDYPIGYLVAVKAALESEGIDRANQLIETAKQFLAKDFVEEYLNAEVEKYTQREIEHEEEIRTTEQAFHSPINKKNVFGEFATDAGVINDSVASELEEIDGVNNIVVDDIASIENIESLPTEENIAPKDYDIAVSEELNSKNEVDDDEDININEVSVGEVNANEINTNVINIDEVNINTIANEKQEFSEESISETPLSDEDISNMNWASLTAEIPAEVTLDMQMAMPEVVSDFPLSQNTDLIRDDIPLYDKKEAEANEVSYNEELIDYTAEETDVYEEDITQEEETEEFELPQEDETKEGVYFDEVAIEEDSQETAVQELLTEDIEPESEPSRLDRLGEYQKFANAMQDAFESTIYHQPEVIIPEIEFSAKFDGENPENNDISDEELVIQEVETNYNDEEQTYYNDYSEKYQGMRGFALKFMGKKAPGRKFQSERLNSLPGLNNTPSNISGGSCNMAQAYRPIPQEPAFNIDEIPSMELNNFSFVMDSSNESAAYVAGEEMEDYSASQDGSVAIVSDTMANILAMQGAYSEAIEMLEKLKSMYPDKIEEYQEKIDKLQLKIDNYQDKID